MTWIDTHAHLNGEEFRNSLEDVLRRAQEAGVERIVVIGTTAADSREGVEMARRHLLLRASVGLQPNNLAEGWETEFDEIVTMALHPEVVAIGETGLDQHWKTVPFHRQQASFRRHLELARSLKRPVVIHCRDAEEEVRDALAAFADQTGEPIAGVMHSYTGGFDFVRSFLDLGLHVSFAGMLTFKKNVALREVAAIVPLDRLLVETDSPYLSPEPFRGKQNEPARVMHTGACLAEVHGVSEEAMAEATTRNARRLFQLD